MKPPSVPLRKNQLFSERTEDIRIRCTARRERALRAINTDRVFSQVVLKFFLADDTIDKRVHDGYHGTRLPVRRDDHSVYSRYYDWDRHILFELH